MLKWPKIKKDNIFEKNIILLKKIKKKLINYKKYKNLVLGTTVNASFVDEIIRDMLSILSEIKKNHSPAHL